MSKEEIIGAYERLHDGEALIGFRVEAADYDAFINLDDSGGDERLMLAFILYMELVNANRVLSAESFEIIWDNGDLYFMMEAATN